MMASLSAQIFTGITSIENICANSSNMLIFAQNDCTTNIFNNSNANILAEISLNKKTHYGLTLLAHVIVLARVMVLARIYGVIRVIVLSVVWCYPWYGVIRVMVLSVLWCYPDKP